MKRSIARRSQMYQNVVNSQKTSSKAGARKRKLIISDVEIIETSRAMEEKLEYSASSSGPEYATAKRKVMRFKPLR